MASKTFAWSTIPNIEIRGPRRVITARVQVAGKEVWRSTRIEADPEGKNAPAVREWLRAFRLEMVRDVDRLLAITKTRDEHSTFGELFAAYRAACAGRDIALSSVERAIKDMRLIVRTVHGGDNTGVDASRTSRCTVQLLVDFKARRIAEFKAECEAERVDAEAYQRRLQSCLVSIKSTIQHARSVFAQECRQQESYRELVLPNLEEFLAYRSGGSTTRAFEMPAPAVLQQLRDGAALFATTQPAMWLALCLTANFGLRRGSARVAKWAWFTARDDGSALLRVRVAKGNQSTVGVSPATWAALQPHKAKAEADGREHVLPGIDDAARDAVLESVKVWLRGIGFDEVRCPLHELRGLFVNTMAAEHSLDAAQGATGHSTQKVMMDSYVARGTDKWVQVV